MGYADKIELNFLIAGHTKFMCDQLFGVIKKRFRRTMVSSLDDLVKVRKQKENNQIYVHSHSALMLACLVRPLRVGEGACQDRLHLVKIRG